MHVFGKLGKPRIVRLGQGGKQGSRGLARIRQARLIARPVLVMRQQLLAVILVERTLARVFNRDFPLENVQGE